MRKSLADHPVSARLPTIPIAPSAAAWLVCGALAIALVTSIVRIVGQL